VLAHVARALGLPMAANVIEVTPGDSWRLVRQRWAGSLLEDAALDAPIRLLTSRRTRSRPTAAPRRPRRRSARFEPSSSRPTSSRASSSREAKAIGGVSLSDAKVVVGAGAASARGGFERLEELASLLGGAVGGSRVVTSLGWRPHSDQIGQTGLRIAPDLYIACGISGAIQHIVGCKAAKRILAINTDPESPILAVADYAVNR
jgi:electron transfer flavoprotein alpha subunit